MHKPWSYSVPICWLKLLRSNQFFGGRRKSGIASFIWYNGPSLCQAPSSCSGNTASNEKHRATRYHLHTFRLSVPTLVCLFVIRYLRRMEVRKLVTPPPPPRRYRRVSGYVLLLYREHICVCLDVLPPHTHRHRRGCSYLSLLVSRPCVEGEPIWDAWRRTIDDVWETQGTRRREPGSASYPPVDRHPEAAGARLGGGSRTTVPARHQRGFDTRACVRDGGFRGNIHEDCLHVKQSCLYSKLT